MQAYVTNPAGTFRSGIKSFRAISPHIFVVYTHPETPLLKPGELPRLGEPNKITLYTDSTRSTLYTTTNTELTFVIYRNSTVIDTIQFPSGYSSFNGTLENSSTSTGSEILAHTATSLTKSSGTEVMDNYVIEDYL